MKNSFKIFSAFIFLIALSIAFSAFRAEAPKAAALTSLWYEYDGSGSITDASNYDLLASQPSGEEEAAAICEGNQEICVIQAPEGSSGKPATFDGTMTTEISDAQTNHVESANVKLRQE